MKMSKIILPSILYLSNIISSAGCPTYHSDIISKCEPELQKIFNLSLTIRKLNADIALYNSKFEQLYAKSQHGCKKEDKECACLENVLEKHSELKQELNDKQGILASVESRLSPNCKMLAQFRRGLVRLSSDK